MLLSLLWKLAGFIGGSTFDKLLGGLADLLQRRASDDLARFQTGVAADKEVALKRVEAEIERVLGLFLDGGLLFCTSHFVQDHCSVEELLFAYDMVYRRVRELGRARRGMG